MKNGDFSKLIKKLNKSCSEYEHNEMRFPEDIDSSLRDFSFTVLQMQQILALLNAQDNLSCTLNLSLTKLSDIIRTLTFSNKNIKNVIVSYHLSSQEFSQLSDVLPKINFSTLLNIDEEEGTEFDDELYLNFSKLTLSSPRATPGFFSRPSTDRDRPVDDHKLSDLKPVR
jgi:hypothetical protein